MRQWKTICLICTQFFFGLTFNLVAKNVRQCCPTSNILFAASVHLWPRLCQFASTKWIKKIANSGDKNCIKFVSKKKALGSVKLSLASLSSALSHLWPRHAGCRDRLEALAFVAWHIARAVTLFVLYTWFVLYFVLQISFALTPPYFG